MTTTPMLLVTSNGLTWAIPGGAAEADAAMKAGYIKPAPNVWVSTAGARIDAVTGTVLPATT